LHFHNLSECLEVALRQTNAQFEPSAVLERLAVDTFENNATVDGETGGPRTGWDLFSLKYFTKGPIGMVVSEECSLAYTRLFHFGWRLKRLSFLLTNLWHRLMASTNSLRKYAPDFAPSFLHRLQLPACEMSHFVECMLYYFLFEVLECDWHVFQRGLSKEGANLDAVIALHETFLEKVLRKSFLIDEYGALLEKFSAMLDVVFDFHRVCDSLLDAAMAHAELNDPVNTNKGNVTALAKETREKKRAVVLAQLESVLDSKLTSVLDDYRSSLRQFLGFLIDQSDDELRSLSLRLDFSGYYFKKEYGMETPLSYKRLSDRKASVEFDEEY